MVSSGSRLSAVSAGLLEWSTSYIAVGTRTAASGRRVRPRRGKEPAVTAGATIGELAGITAPGRLGDPSLTIGTDPRSDPRMVEALAAFGLDVPSEPVAVSVDAPLSELRAWCEGTEEGFEAVFAALVDGLPPVQGVTSETVTVAARDGHEIRLYVHRPADASGALPVHLPRPRRRDGADRGGRAVLPPLARRAGGNRPGGGRRRVPQRRRQARPAPVPDGSAGLRRRPPLGRPTTSPSSGPRTSSCRASPVAPISACR